MKQLLAVAVLVVLGGGFGILLDRAIGIETCMNAKRDIVAAERVGLPSLVDANVAEACGV